MKKFPLRILAVGLCLALAACAGLEGLEFSLTPGGQVALKYTIPEKAKVVDDKGSK